MEIRSRVVPEKKPWLTKAEFEDVYSGLYSEDLLKKRTAVERITVWESRCHPALPMSIDATAALVRAQIQDSMFLLNSDSPCLPGDIRLLYCTALIRFVNVHSEIAQPYDHSASVRRAAHKVGIPDWIVDLRHQSAHQSLPNLELLRKGSSFALEWLQNEYWEPELQNFVDFVIPIKKSTREDCEKVISCFQNCQFALMATELTSLEVEDYKAYRVTNLKRTTELLKSDCKTFFETLLRPGLFLHSTRELTDILMSGESSNEVPLFLREETVSLPERLLNFWMPLLKVMFRENCIPQFVEHLLKCQYQPDHIHQKIVVAWALYLVQIGDEDYENFGIYSEEEKPIFNWLHLLYLGARYPCMYSPPILEILSSLVYPPIDIGAKNQIMAKVAIKTGIVVPSRRWSREGHMQRVFTVEKLKRDMQLEPLTGPYGWEVAESAIDWSKLPLGNQFPSSAEKDKMAISTKTGEAAESNMKVEVVQNKEETDDGGMVVECITEDLVISESDGDMAVGTRESRSEEQESFDREQVVCYYEVS